MTKTIEEQKEFIYKDFETFTLYAMNLKELDESVIYEVVSYVNNNLTAYNYYKLLRILRLMVETMPECIKILDKFYLDEQLITNAVSYNKDVIPLLKTHHRVIYLTDNWAYKTLRSLIRTYRFFRASV